MNDTGKALLGMALAAANTAMLFLAMEYEVWNGIYLGFGFLVSMLFIADVIWGDKL